MLKTTVIMATYNGKKFLKEQLDSIRDQELPADRVIIRDDKSTDGTVSFVKNYISENKLNNWEVKQNEKNIGWRLNFRQLLIDSQEKETNIVFFSDQDDCWRLSKNRRQVEVLEKHLGIELLSGDVEVKKISKNATTPRYISFPDHKQEISKYPTQNAYKSYRSGWTMAIRSSFIKDILRYWATDYNFTHDVLLTSLSSLLGIGYNLNEVVGTHLRHSGNASGKSLLKLWDPKEAHLSELYKFVGFYDVMVSVLQKRHSSQAQEIRNYYNFYIKRYGLAQANKLFPVFKQVLMDWKYYASMSGRVRDVWFAFKRIKNNDE